MWEIEQKMIKEGRLFEYWIRKGERRLSFAEVIDLWKEDPGFRTFYTDLLCKPDWSAYFWEHPPLNKGCLDQEYRFVLVKAEVFAGLQADPRPFSEHFGAKSSIIDFPNRGGDASLVVPQAIAREAYYAHLASFLRNAPKEQVHALWQRTAEVLLEKIDDQNLWLSTHGLGVYWLHLRLDSYPKYYHYQPYKRQAHS